MTKANKGFTLAEVLIALVIIGIIAAITVPVIMQNTKRVEYSSRIKKFYSMLSNAATKAKADGNDWGEWAESASKETDLNSNNSQGIAKTFLYQYLLPYINYIKVEENGAFNYVYLSDGTYFQEDKGECIDFLLDVNGDKKPNSEGRDIFRFLYCPNASIYWKETEMVIPYIKKSTKTREEALALCQSDPSFCSGLLYFDSWEFKDDYPYRL